MLQNQIREGFADHLSRLMLPPPINGGGRSLPDKAAIRTVHAAQRQERLQRSRDFLTKKASQLLRHFASGTEVVPDRISPYIEVVQSGTEQADLFRLASLSWSIPVSEGYGRRMRFLVWDEYSERLLGVIALGDPVFNLHVRDTLIGWSSEERKDGLVNIMDAYVLGAIPPFNRLLAGKLVACLVRTREVRNAFRTKYRDAIGVISGRTKNPQLLAVTTTSALGRSSMYNRLVLNGVRYFEPIGYTMGYGHFHVPAELFEQMREYLRLIGDPYANNNRFGNGPNWKFRAIRAALERVDCNREYLHHGIKREVFFCGLAKNATQVLRREASIADVKDLQTVKEVGRLAVERWAVPRARRTQAYLEWTRDDFLELVRAAASG